MEVFWYADISGFTFLEPIYWYFGFHFVNEFMESETWNISILRKPPYIFCFSNMLISFWLCLFEFVNKSAVFLYFYTSYDWIEWVRNRIQTFLQVDISLAIYRSSCLQVFHKTCFLKNFAKFIRKNLCESFNLKLL